MLCLSTVQSCQVQPVRQLERKMRAFIVATPATAPFAQLVIRLLAEQRRKQ